MQFQSKKTKSLFTKTVEMENEHDVGELKAVEIENEHDVGELKPVEIENYHDIVELKPVEIVTTNEHVEDDNNVELKNAPCCSSSTVDTLLKIDLKLDRVITGLKELPQKVQDILPKSKTECSSVNVENNQDNFKRHMEDLKNADSMKCINNNPLIKNTFSLLTNEDEEDFMKCDICAKWDNPKATKNLGISLVEGRNYSVFQSGIKKPSPEPFQI